MDSKEKLICGNNCNKWNICIDVGKKINYLYKLEYFQLK